MHIIMVMVDRYSIIYCIPVLHNPVLVIIVGAIPNDQHGMVETCGVTLAAGVDAFRVELKPVS